MTEKKLTKKQIQEISLGYVWSPNMSYGEFVKNNPRIHHKKRWSVYNMIEDRYIKEKHEDK